MPEAVPDPELDADIRIGEFRCESERASASPLYIPPPARWNTRRDELLASQRSVLSEKEIMAAYVELLSRATMLVQFIDHNMGPDDDWPLMLIPDSEAATDGLDYCLGRLRSVTSYLEDMSAWPS